jgi:acetyl esterase
LVKEYWYFLAGVCVVLIPLALILAIERLDLLEIRPDRKLVYKREDGWALELHVFEAKSENAGATAPALLLFHGGRWKYGSARNFYPQCKYFARQGYACFSAQYRLGKGGRTDVRAAVADARSAFEYLSESAASLRIDPDRIVAGGGSSGGHLAAMLGVWATPTRGRSPEGRGVRPAALILLNPMLDLSPCRPDHHLVKQYWREVSPFHQVDRHFPPSLVLLGSDDPELPVDSARAFCDAVRGKGGRCELAVFEGQSHGFFNYRPGQTEYFDKTNKCIVGFLDDLWR